MGSVSYYKSDWALDVIGQCAKCKFHGGDESDDLPDTVAAALIYVRQTYRVVEAAPVIVFIKTLQSTMTDKVIMPLNAKCKLTVANQILVRSLRFLLRFGITPWQLSYA